MGFFFWGGGGKGRGSVCSELTVVICATSQPEAISINLDVLSHLNKYPLKRETLNTWVNFKI